jgi:pSer/pThr/pTyr-binding forkhead associated (FHA) protein
VRLDDPSISQCHAYFQMVEGNVFGIDLGSRMGVIWDDGSQGRGWVRPDQILRVGIFDVTVESSSSTPAVDPIVQTQQISDTLSEPILSLASVEIHSATPAINGVHSLDRPITLLGRHRNCELRLVDESVAYFQCAFVNTTDGLWFVDTMSRQGAVLNGRNIRLARLRDADLLEIGRVSLLCRIGAAAQGNPLTLREPAALPSGVDALATLSGKVAEAVAGAFAPVGEMMNQFQQCFVSMAQMVTTMQKEHAVIVSEQARQIQALAGEVRELRAQIHHTQSAPAATTVPSTNTPAPSIVPPPHPTAEPVTAAARLPTPSLPVSDSQTLTDAHSWFMSRLAKKGHVPAPDAKQ